VGALPGLEEPTRGDGLAEVPLDSASPFQPSDSRTGVRTPALPLLVGPKGKAPGGGPECLSVLGEDLPVICPLAEDPGIAFTIYTDAANGSLRAATCVSPRVATSMAASLALTSSRRLARCQFVRTKMKTSVRRPSRAGKRSA
jgi:hypothetical protein